MHTSSSGGTHAGLVAGRALLRAVGDGDVPPVLAIGVAKGVVLGVPDVKPLAERDAGADRVATRRCSTTTSRSTTAGSAPTTAWRRRAGGEGIRWAAVHGGWVLDATYTGKGFAGLLGNAATGRWRAGDEVVFIHTGGLPAVFAAVMPVGPRLAARATER